LQMRASKGRILIIVGVFLISQAFSMTADYWLAIWTDDTSTGDTIYFLKLYIVFGVITLIFAVVRSVTFYSSVLNSSEAVFQQMLYSVFHAHSYFIQKTPFGRIVNRFAKDIADTDEMLPQASFDLMERLLIIIGILILVAVAFPWTLLVYPFIIFTFFLYLRTYLSAIRRVKRLEAVVRSPIYTSMIVALEGKATVRAFKAEERLHDKFCVVQNEHTRVHFASLSMARWFGVKVDGLVCIFFIIVVYGVVLLKNPLQLSTSYVGLVIYLTLHLFDGVQGFVKQSAEVQNLMAAVGRSVEFAVNLPQESLQGSRPQDSWPELGEITISNLSLRYPDSDFDTLSNITATIPAGKKTCILGRTGAGKSSLIQTIFRLYESVDDSISIDGVSTSELSLFYLRSRLTIIPQEPIFFHGSLRFNLDPYEEYTDDKLWAALELVNLKNKVSASSAGLEFPIFHQGGTQQHFL
jgi:ATP-binding cassette subfamily C (CFTR/MRP) protein 4